MKSKDRNNREKKERLITSSLLKYSCPSIVQDETYLWNHFIWHFPLSLPLHWLNMRDLRKKKKKKKKPKIYSHRCPCGKRMHFYSFIFLKKVIPSLIVLLPKQIIVIIEGGGEEEEEISIVTCSKKIIEVCERRTKWQSHPYAIHTCSRNTLG